MPPSNFFFQIGWFLTGSRTTIPPSADTRTLTGSVVRPMRTFGAEGPHRSDDRPGQGTGVGGRRYRGPRPGQEPADLEEEVRRRHLPRERDLRRRGAGGPLPR